jgi:hypothetical protein
MSSERDQSAMSGYDTGTTDNMNAMGGGGTAMGSGGSTGGGMSSSQGRSSESDIMGDDEDNSARQ